MFDHDRRAPTDQVSRGVPFQRSLGHAPVPPASCIFSTPPLTTHYVGTGPADGPNRPGFYAVFFL